MNTMFETGIVNLLRCSLGCEKTLDGSTSFRDLPGGLEPLEALYLQNPSLTLLKCCYGGSDFGVFGAEPTTRWVAEVTFSPKPPKTVNTLAWSTCRADATRGSGATTPIKPHHRLSCHNNAMAEQRDLLGMNQNQLAKPRIHM